MLGFGLGDIGWVSYVVYLLFCFCTALNSSFMDDSCCVFFMVSFLPSLSPVPLIRCYQCLETAVCAYFVKLFQNSGFLSLVCEFSWKREITQITITLQGVYVILYITFIFLGQVYPFSLLFIIAPYAPLNYFFIMRKCISSTCNI